MEDLGQFLKAFKGALDSCHDQSPTTKQIHSPLHTDVETRVLNSLISGPFQFLIFDH